MKSQIENRYGARAEEYFKLYPVQLRPGGMGSERPMRCETIWPEPHWRLPESRTGQQTYIYYFDRQPPGHDSDHYGAYHSAELVYVFNNLDSVKRPWTETDRKLADTMSSYWVNFAKSGDPNRRRASQLAGLWRNSSSRPGAGRRK